MKIFTLLSAFLITGASYGMNKTFCGKLELQGGKAQIIRNSEVILRLNDKELFNQANRMVKLQDQSKYCIVSEVDYGVPLNILDAYEFETSCGSMNDILVNDKSLKEANTFIGLNDRGQRGMQKELKYCLDYKLTSHGEKEKVIYGYEFRTYCGTLTNSEKNTFLVNGNNVTLIVAVNGGITKLRDQAKTLLNGDFEFGKAYCLDARLHERGWETEIIGARPLSKL